ncbi:MAG: YSC84-related protein [Pseudomonadota bacterium]
MKTQAPLQTTLLTLFLLLTLSPLGHTASKLEIDTRVAAVIDKLYAEQPAAASLGAKASGVLVFPRIIQGGVGVGGEVGEGALLVNGATSQYYRVTSLSFGFQLGGQAKSQIIMFMTDESLRQFVESDGWEAGVDGSVAVIEFGVGKEIDTNNIRDAIIAFIFDNKGLMYNLSLEGTKFWKIAK